MRKKFKFPPTAHFGFTLLGLTFVFFTFTNTLLTMINGLPLGIWKISQPGSLENAPLHGFLGKARLKEEEHEL